MSPLDKSNLPAEIGDYYEQRPVQAFLMWRSHGPDVDAKGRNFRLSVFMFHESGGFPEIDELSEPTRRSGDGTGESSGEVSGRVGSSIRGTNR